ncbi:MAG: M48 family metallopeptidase [Salinisphaeraceae bacterium]
MHKRNLIVVLLAALATIACATSPTGRPQLKLFPSSDLAEMGAASYQQMKQETPIEQSSRVNNYVQCVANAITSQTGGTWEVTVFADDQANAFALPGGKIGVYTGLLDVSRNQDQLATVIGHEVAHVLADHGNERVSSQFATQSALQLAGAIAGGGNSGMGQAAMAALGLGAQVGVLLPFSRAQESEADVVGLELMARAGFDPRASVQLWQNMAQSGGGSPPEFLSTHPGHESRINKLNENIPKAMPLYQQARNAGRRPNCG